MVFFGLSSDSFSPGNEGVSGGIFASAITGNGNGGNLTINTDKLTINDLGTINVSNFQTLGVRDPGQGAAGNLEINANSIEVNNGNITAANANGIGGRLTINADSLSLDNQGKVEAFTRSTTGEGGVIDLNINDNLFLRNGSEISALTENGADGGTIDIDANAIVAFPNQNNDIVANALQGNGGDINITTEALLGLEERSSNPENQTNDIDASSDFGLSGNVSISTPDVSLTERIVELPTNTVEAEQNVAQACRRDRLAGVSSGLTIEGKGGIPTEPGLPLDSRNISVNGQTNTTSAIPAPIETAQGKIQPARGVKVTESGEIILTAYRTSNAGDRIPEKRNCS